MPAWSPRRRSSCCCVFSVVSWGIILYKSLALRPGASGSRQSFLDVFRKSAKFSEVQAVCKSLEHSPLVGLFQAGYAELNPQLRADAKATPASPTRRRRRVQPSRASPRSTARCCGRRRSEVNKLEQRVTFLATTASIAPFIGLFGTVWGIMTAFPGIGAQGSTDLGGRGARHRRGARRHRRRACSRPSRPSTSTTTSPRRVKVLASEMDDFALEFLNIAERNFT